MILERYRQSSFESIRSRPKSNFGVEPPASETIIVSPIAREMASTIEATIPDNAQVRLL